MAKIVVTEALNPQGVQVLRAAGHEVIEGWKLDEAARLKAMEEADGWLVRIMPVGEELLARCPKLKIMSKHGVGVDNFDLDAARARGITVTTTPGANSQSVAEHAVALMMSLAKNIIPISRGYREKGFAVKTSMEGMEIKGKTLGIIGCGAIGSRVAHMAAGGLDMHVLVFDPYISEVPAGCERCEDLTKLLAQSDVVTLHCWLSDETRHLIDADALSAMKPGALLINCARGPIVEEAALTAALKEGRLGGAGLDVTEEEPLPADHPFFTMPNVIVTPHYAPTTKEAAVGVAVMAAENLNRFFAGEAVIGKVCP